MIWNRREEDRLNVVSPIEEELARAERIGLVAHENRDDRCCSPHDRQAEILQPARQASDVRVEPRAKHIVFARAEDIDDCRDRFQKGRDDRPAEDIGARADLEQAMKRLGTANELPAIEKALESDPTTKVLS